MRRLFSTFAHGAPGLGLLLLRVVTGLAVIFLAAMALLGGSPLGPTILYALTGVVGLLLLVGLWTPIAGTIVTFFEVWRIISQHGDLWTNVLLAGLGVSLALIGPGHWSLDARLFGWKRIDVSTEKH